LSTIIAIALVIITIIFSVFYANNNSALGELSEGYDDLLDEIEPIVECCSTNVTNCTCSGPGTTVECWDASTNTPNITSGVPPNGTDLAILYIVCTPGNTTVDGKSDWELGDYVRWVPDDSKWYQNKAMGQPIEMETFNFNWTCSTWVFDVPGQMIIWTLAPDMYMIHVSGAYSPISTVQGCNAGTTPPCVLQTPDLPVQYQTSSDNEISFTIGTFFDREIIPFKAKLTTNLVVGTSIQINGTYTIIGCTPPGEPSEPVGFDYVEFVYTTDI
jgi:hypothetical protein